MLRDNKAFRERYKRWKAGELVYDKGRPILPEFKGGTEDEIDYDRWDNAELTSYFVPFIKEKAVKLTNAGRATGAILSTNLLDTLADNAERAGIPVKTGIGISVKETTLGNPTDDRTAWNMSSGIRRAFNGKYPGTFLHINAHGDGRDEREMVINYHKGRQVDESEKKGKSVVQEAFEFYKKHPNAYNTRQKGYSKMVDKVADEVWKSPEVQEWYKQRTMLKVQKDMKNLGKHWVRPRYAGGTEPNAFDKWREAHSAISNVASFVPGIGTAMDIYDAYKDPTAANIGYAALSAVTDLVGGRLIAKAVGQSIKRAKVIKKLTKEAKREMLAWPFYRNMGKEEAKRLIEYIAKRLAERQAEQLGLSTDGFVDEIARYVIPAAVYMPDALANLNQVTQRNNTVE